ncbi:MAG: hypothetical protein ACXVB6_06460 [Mucilaginibacter sp.]
MIDHFSLKLNYRVSKPTNLEPTVINERILLKLNDEKYNVIEATDHVVTFKERPWVLMSNAKAARRLDGGRFEIGVADNNPSLSLHYYLNLVPLLVMVSVLEIATIYNRFYVGGIFFGIFFFIALLIQLLVSRGVANGMLSEILYVDVVD